MTVDDLFKNSVMLTLERCRDKSIETLSYLSDNNIVVKEWFGFDCNITGLRTEHTFELDHPNSGYKIGSKTVNMALSHYSIWQFAYFSNLPTITIFENDVRFIDGWRSILNRNVRYLPEDWDLFFIGSCCCQEYTDKIHIAENIFKVQHVLCTHAYIINNKALPNMLKYQKIWAPIDIHICLGPLLELNVYAMFPRIAEQKNTVLPI